jgi:hypothetical protein
MTEEKIQAEWVRAVANLRGELLKRSESMADWDLSGIRTLSDLICQAMTLDMRARCWARELEAREARQPWDNAC